MLWPHSCLFWANPLDCPVKVSWLRALILTVEGQRKYGVDSFTPTSHLRLRLALQNLTHWISQTIRPGGTSDREVSWSKMKTLRLYSSWLKNQLLKYEVHGDKKWEPTHKEQEKEMNWSVGDPSGPPQNCLLAMTIRNINSTLGLFSLMPANSNPYSNCHCF